MTGVHTCAAKVKFERLSYKIRDQSSDNGDGNENITGKNVLMSQKMARAV